MRNTNACRCRQNACAACRARRGATGPTGPTGTLGPTGANGGTGATGPTGPSSTFQIDQIQQASTTDGALTTTSTAYTPIVCATIVPRCGDLLIDASFAVRYFNGVSQGVVALTVDGVVVFEAETDLGAGPGLVFTSQAGAFVHRMSVAPNVPHQICVQWRLALGSGALTLGPFGHASVRVLDLCP